MKSIFRQTSPADLEAVSAFLNRIFGDAPVTTQPANLHWKYWTPRQTDWQGSRGCVLERENAIVAHGCAWPLRILTPGNSMPAIHVIDWAADAATTGAGVSIMKQMARLGNAVVAAGGTGMTKRILPAFGFKPRNVIRYYARPLRPLRQVRTHQRREGLRAIVRLARNSAWSWIPQQVPENWSAHRIVAADLPARCWPQPTPELAVFERTPALFHYLTQCPTTEVRLYGIQDSGKWKGYFVLVFVPGTARVADAWTTSGVDGWRALYRLASRCALEYDAPGGSVNEIVTASGLAEAQQALIDCGYRYRKEEHLMLYQVRDQLPQHLPVHYQMIDADVAFLHAGKPEYFT